jgi:transposase
MKNVVIGIDFSKETFDATILRVNELSSKGLHEQFSNNKTGLAKFVKWAKSSIGEELNNETIICGENTGVYSRLFSDTLSKKGYTVWIESPLRIKRSLGISRGKNDKKDSRDIAEYAARHQDKCKPYKAPSEQIDALQTLFAQRRLLIIQRTSIQRRKGEIGKKYHDNEWLRPTSHCDERVIEVLNREIQAIEKQMLVIINNSKELKKNYEILTSMPGIALVNAVALLVYTDNFNRFDFDARKICAYWGVAPFTHESGSSIRGGNHVSGFSDKYLKSLMDQAALSAIRSNSRIAAYAAHLTEMGKHKNIVKNNCKNKMLHVLVAMVRTQKKYGEQKIAS